MMLFRCLKLKMVCQMVISGLNVPKIATRNSAYCNPCSLLHRDRVEKLGPHSNWKEMHEIAMAPRNAPEERYDDIRSEYPTGASSSSTVKGSSMGRAMERWPWTRCWGGVVSYPGCWNLQKGAKGVLLTPPGQYPILT
jgi:hypothetical protein